MRCSSSASSRVLWKWHGAWSRAVDKYIVENQPWALGEKQDDESRSQLATTLYTSAEALRIVTALAHPIIPDATAKIWTQLGLGRHSQVPALRFEVGTASSGDKTRRRTAGISTRRQERDRKDAADGRAGTRLLPQSLSRKRKQPHRCATGGTPCPPKPAATVPDGKISIEDFAKVELRVGQVKVAEKVKGADKLLRLEVDLGTEVRQVVAGIAEAYAPETLIGRKVVIVVNLAPRKLRGLESNGMIVAASPEGGKPILASFLEDVPVGTRLK